MSENAQIVNGKVIMPLAQPKKKELLDILKRDNIVIVNDIDIDIDGGLTETYTIKDQTGKALFKFTNKKDCGSYTICLGEDDSNKIADIVWHTNDNHTSPEQQNVFDVFDAIIQKDKELERAKKIQQKYKEAKQTLEQIEQHLKKHTDPSINLQKQIKGPDITK